MSSANAIVDKSLDFRTWNQKREAGLNLITSPLLDECKELVHAFTTRLGGQTAAPYDSFNLGRHIKDPQLQEDALSNRKKLLQSLDLDYESAAIPGQVHSANVRVVESASPRPELKEVDGLLTSSTQLALMLHFADCVPVIIYDRVKRRLGIFHAGWRGTAAKIVVVGVELMIREYGSLSADMIAAVGPAIGRCCYPTGTDVVEALSSTVKYPQSLFAQLDGATSPDLKAINAMQLIEAGVGEVDISDWCTACNPEIFYSHRQSGGVTGRQAAVCAII